MAKLDGIRRGRMSAEEDKLVEELACRRWSPGRIAGRLNRHPATIAWALYRLGLRAPGPASGRSYMRGGIMVRQFSTDEDAYIETLRVAGHKPKAIAKAASARFGTNRSPHTINMRLLMLANRDVDSAPAQEAHP